MVSSCIMKLLETPKGLSCEIPWLKNIGFLSWGLNFNRNSQQPPQQMKLLHISIAFIDSS